MIVGITGTPGTGKTTLSIQLRSLGHPVLDINEITRDHDLFLNYDDVRQTHEVDIDGLNNYFQEYIHQKIKKTNVKNANHQVIEHIFIEGHVAHLLKILEQVIILRCNPETLRHRLTDKGWVEKKIQENIEAEALDVVLIDVMEEYSENKIFEIDTTNETPENILKITMDIVNENIKGYKPGNIDWSEEIMKWF